ncbi:MAG: DUF2905 family protein [Chlamydiota bacterium]
MVSRFLFWFCFFTILGGLFLHFQTPFPHYLAWFGRLPGDMVVVKGTHLIHFPLVSASIFSAATLFLSSLFGARV